MSRPAGYTETLLQLVTVSAAVTDLIGDVIEIWHNLRSTGDLRDSMTMFALSYYLFRRSEEVFPMKAMK